MTFYKRAASSNDLSVHDPFQSIDVVKQNRLSDVREIGTDEQPAHSPLGKIQQILPVLTRSTRHQSN